jgi:hypothetical protein
MPLYSLLRKREERGARHKTDAEIPIRMRRATYTVKKQYQSSFALSIVSTLLLIVPLAAINRVLPADIIPPHKCR